ncbi:MAG: hypothetical protein HQK77_11905 [Desulfobacterales bacterium]|nr:hypothetical protein [Desulfobacterales bacterium]
MAITQVRIVDEWVRVHHVLISVSDKQNLDYFVPQLLHINPTIKIFSTGGTYNYLKTILKDKASETLTQVSDYTGQPETQGGLVKTLDFKIYLGLLTETYNESHQLDMRRCQAVPIDMVVVNLYPFQETVSKSNVTAEVARGNIDIGGPCMIRAAAKNFLRVASVVDPSDYASICEDLMKNQGRCSLKLRYSLAQKAFQHTSGYDQAIAEYLSKTSFENVAGCYDRR